MNVIDIVSNTDSATSYRVVEDNTGKELTLSEAMMLRVKKLKALDKNKVLLIVER